jgi:hypothetical protein
MFVYIKMGRGLRSASIQSALLVQVCGMGELFKHLQLHSEVFQPLGCLLKLANNTGKEQAKPIRAICLLHLRLLLVCFVP